MPNLFCGYLCIVANHLHHYCDCSGQNCALSAAINYNNGAHFILTMKAKRKSAVLLWQMWWLLHIWKVLEWLCWFILYSGKWQTICKQWQVGEILWQSFSKWIVRKMSEQQVAIIFSLPSLKLYFWLKVILCIYQQTPTSPWSFIFELLRLSP